MQKTVDWHLDISAESKWNLPNFHNWSIFFYELQQTPALSNEKINIGSNKDRMQKGHGRFDDTNAIGSNEVYYWDLVCRRFRTICLAACLFRCFHELTYCSCFQIRAHRHVASGKSRKYCSFPNCEVCLLIHQISYKFVKVAKDRTRCFHVMEQITKSLTTKRFCPFRSLFLSDYVLDKLFYGLR